jgi:hypothetical protein
MNPPIRSLTAATVAVALFSSAAHAASKCYEVAMRGMAASENFFVLATDPVLIKKAEDQLKLPEKERAHIHGPIDTGNGGFNGKWHWHIVPDKWTPAEISVELCDGTPSYVESHRDEWVKTVKQYCPWSSYLSRECQAAGMGPRPERWNAAPAGTGFSGDSRILADTRAAGDGTVRRIEYEIGSAGLIGMEVHSAEGRVEATLLETHRGPGSFFLDWDTAALPRGLHHLILKKNGRPASARTVLLR